LHLGLRKRALLHSQFQKRLSYRYLDDESVAMSPVFEPRGELNRQATRSNLASHQHICTA
jgi:hypothetical protein